MQKTPRKGVLNEIEQNRLGFAVAFLAVFTVSFIFLASIGATPDPLWEEQPRAQGGTPVPAAATATPELPVRIKGEKIGLEALINNPVSTDVEVLDKALLSGAVRYPTSGQLNVDGTVLLFGHSSYLPIVHNRSYKAFNEIQKLAAGDTVNVYSSDKEYRFRVTSVRKADATEDSIELPSDGQHLILVTCDSFAKKTDRFIVSADLVGVYALSTNTRIKFPGRAL